ncbi:uncharacterized protein N7477_006751 [Penicillium maclennaniae]|uniref:uncharacterized protein n=1 Tax=Penicillium maclennaniae TaxID=1343394 RepID=UPI002541CBD0|nr:uncharacterized protein N7477_006751 [Penicillium maclennaniae]KAJ5668181.1 hypothetical protein N7477_006751 [Penicillium maclennaniae]
MLGLTIDDLRSDLTYQPEALNSGTSGRRGWVVHLTQLEIYTNPSEGGIHAGDDFYYAHDLRPSSIRIENGRGGLCQAVRKALEDAGMHPINLGAIPTPALTHFALKNGKGSIMVMGSHIPFERNGYKLNTSKGELLKKHEQPINNAGMFCNVLPDLVPAVSEGKTAYIQCYRDFFEGLRLEGMKLLVYQHSVVGRDLLVEFLQMFGADVTPAGRSETFLPIDTEAIDEAQLNTVQDICTETGQTFDGIVSTDGDSDRPLLLAPEGDRLRFFSGDLLDMIVAEYLRADAVVVPISTNDGIDRGPYVISGIQNAVSKGRHGVCGWEANGGFLTGFDIDQNERILSALPTRDAVLPLLCALFAARNKQCTLPEIVYDPSRLFQPRRIDSQVSSANELIMKHYSPPEAIIQKVSFDNDNIIAFDPGHATLRVTEPHAQQLVLVRRELCSIFSAKFGFSAISWINFTDGIRMIFADGDFAHIRPSGNADELRIYAVSSSRERTDAIIRMGIAELDGLLRRLGSMV